MEGGFIGGLVVGCRRKQGVGVRGCSCRVEGDGGKKGRDRDRRIRAVALPLLATFSVEPLLALVDTAFVGQIGTAQLAGVGISSFILKATTTFLSVFLPVTTTTITAEGGNVEKTSVLVAQVLLVAGILGTFVGLGLILAAPTLCTLMAGAASAESIPFGVTYMRWRGVVVPAVVASFVMSGTFRGMQDTVSPLKAAIFANVVNGVLDYVMIFGFGWGVAGAAIATSISQLVSLGLLVRIAIQKGYLSASAFGSLPGADLLKELSSASVLLVRNLASLLIFASSSKLAAIMGTASVAAFEVGKQLFSFQALTFQTLNVTMMTLVAVELGEENPLEARKIGDRILTFAAICGLALGTVSYFTSGIMPLMFTRDAAVFAQAKDIMKLFVWTQPLCALAFTIEGCFLATRSYRFMAISNSIAAFGSCLALFSLATSPLALTVTNLWSAINVLFLLRFLFYASRYFSKTTPLTVTTTTTSTPITTTTSHPD